MNEKTNIVNLHNATWVAGGLYIYKVVLMDPWTHEVFPEQYGAGNSIDNAMQAAINSWGRLDNRCQDLDNLQVKSIEYVGPCSFTPGQAE